MYYTHNCSKDIFEVKAYHSKLWDNNFYKDLP
jgi:hypothetical protein